MMDHSKIRSDIAELGDKLFLNSAGASLMPHSVVEKINWYLSQEEKYGGYKLQDMLVHELYEFNRQAGQLLNTAPRNIAFAHDATDAYLKALSSIPFEKGDVILTSRHDYASNQIQFISLSRRYGLEVKRVNELENGDVDLNHLRELIEFKKPKLIAITHIPTNSGMIQDVVSIGRICREYDILYLVDACQSVGQIAVNVAEIQCDFLSTTGRKFLRGPRGTGILYVSDRVLNQSMAPLFIDGKGAVWTEDFGFEINETARRFQTWEAPYAMIYGFIEALKYVNDIDILKIESYNQTLMSHLRQNLRSIKGVSLYDRGSKTSNILTFRKASMSLNEMEQELDRNNVFFSVSTLEWGLLDYRDKGVDGTIRLSPHYFNTIDEMDRVAEIIEQM